MNLYIVCYYLFWKFGTIMVMLPKVYGSTSDANSLHINMNKKLLSDMTIPAARTAQFLELNVKDLVVPMLETHASKQNFTYEWRMKNLRRLRKIITDHMEEWHAVLLEDLGKHTVEARITELNLALSEIDYFLRNLRTFMKPSQVSTMGYYLPCFSQVQDMPMRPPAILIISPSNYPLMLALTAAAGALAAGNPVVLKPSEQTPNVSSLLQQLTTRYMDRGSMVVIEGGPEVVAPLLAEPWGKIVFTGSERVGRIVVEAASRTLTPVLLELGGKSPCYVDETAPSNLKLVAQRIVWGKTINGGQTCVCPDYLLVHEKHVERLVKELTQAVKDQFGNTDAQRQNSELGRLAQTNHASRLVDMLQEAESTPGCQILIGGSQHCRISDRYVCPTLVLNPPLDSRLMTEEIFGPILPIVTVKSRTEAQQIIQSMPGIPLAMYVFTTRKNVFTEMIETCPAGSAVRNDLLIHFGTPHLPMSGKGSSGYGSYRGIYSWRAFTHPQSQAYRPCVSPADFGLLRYHPFGPMKQKLILVLSNMPAIPPLYPMLWLLGISATYITLSVDTLRFALADGMAFIVEWLRK